MNKTTHGTCQDASRKVNFKCVTGSDPGLFRIPPSVGVAFHTCFQLQSPQLVSVTVTGRKRGSQSSD